MKRPNHVAEQVMVPSGQIRPAADSRRGSEKAAATAKAASARLRDELAAFKSRA
jgi:hypothetical protein